EMVCGVDSSQEFHRSNGIEERDGRTLEERIVEAIQHAERVQRYSVLCLGLSDDAVNDVRLRDDFDGHWHQLCPRDDGDMELPIWVDHVGGIGTRWKRYTFASNAIKLRTPLPAELFTQIVGPIETDR